MARSSPRRRRPSFSCSTSQPASLPRAATPTTSELSTTACPPVSAPRLKPVGRLDKDTTGLLLLTDDGELANHLTHPRYGVEKTYWAVIAGVPTDQTLQALREGVELDDGPTAPARVRLLNRGASQCEIEIKIHEGRNRQVRRMCDRVGHPARELERTGYGPLRLGNLARSESRELTDAELRAIRKAAGMPETKSVEIP